MLYDLHPSSVLRVSAVCLLAMLPATYVWGEKPKPPKLEGPVPAQVSAPSSKEISRAMEAGIQFLLSDQNENGSWGSAERTKSLNIYAPVPGAHHAFRAAVTSLCVSALCEVGPDRDDVNRALDRAENWLLEHLPHVRRADGTALYNVWAHAYSIQALVRLIERDKGNKTREQQYRKLIEQQIDLLRRYESVDGGWGYYDFRARTKRPSSSSISFTTATGLIALYEAKQAGIDVPQDVVDRAYRSIQRQKQSDYSYLYGEYLKWRPMHPVNRPGGSLGRSQVCNLALRLWGDQTITDRVVEVWLDRLFARNGWLDMGRKRPIPHESWFAVAGYFFYYGHYYAGQCIELLPPERRSGHQAQLATVLLQLQEKDGSWWDYPLYNYHQQYGTAMALMTLKRCEMEDEG